LLCLRDIEEGRSTIVVEYLYWFLMLWVHGECWWGHSKMLHKNDTSKALQCTLRYRCASNVAGNQMVHVVCLALSPVWLVWVAVDVTNLDCCLPRSCRIIRLSTHHH
jgi:hypothetical protein